MAGQDITRRLSALGLRARSGVDPLLTGLSVDSRKVEPGHLFAALPGTRVHGATFITFALRMGAAALLTDPEGARIAEGALAGWDGALVVTEDPRQALAFAASLWFARQPDTIAAITGTNGKTSVASFLRQIWTALGHEAANLGTTGVEGAYTAPLAHTTPEPITLHRVLAEAAEAGVTHLAMEASSHGLSQRRLDAVNLSAAGFTNLSQDHLDYHENMDAYFAAKSELFTRVLSEDGVAVINIDDARGREMAEIAETQGQDVLRVGHDERAHLRITHLRAGQTGLEMRFHWQARPHVARLDLIGGFQAENAMLAAGLAIACGEAPEAVFATFGQLKTVHGRMELVARRANGAPVFVDYAHTPGALETALRAMRPHVMGRIIVVFGAGGDRDTGKRVLMGRAAAAHADVVIVTDDNPRSEDPAAIRAEVLAGCPGANEVADRAEAILRGVDLLEPGDALLIAGKGHESGQIVGDDVFPFDDGEQASVAVAALEGRLA